MLKEIVKATRPTFDKIGALRNKAFSHIGGYVPDIYTATDAAYYLSQIKDRAYVLGSPRINPQTPEDQAKIWSVAPPVMKKVREIIRKSGHYQPLPFVMGTYDMSDQRMSMNDLSLTDPWLAYLLATGGLEGFAMPVLRGLYYAGRRSWWRHESIHARHHLQMSYFLEAQREARSQDSKWQGGYSLREAGLTIHEAGIEELLTRWQSLKEARGLLEKGVSTLSMLLYLEYTPFTGIRNMFVDGKEKTLDLVKDGKIRIPAKLALALGLLFGPSYLNSQTHFADSLREAAGQQIEAVFWRAQVYVAIAAIGAMFSSKDKGALDRGTEGQHLPTSEYKFPYTYSPVTSTARSIGFMRYLHKVWDQIPHFKRLKTAEDIDPLKREVDDRISSHMNGRQHQFTMQVVEEALGPVEQARRSAFPQDVYLKGVFVPALYLRLRELYADHKP